MELLRLQADIYFHKCVLDTCHKQVITVILIFFLFKKKKKGGEDVTRYVYFRFSGINCQSNKRGLASQKWRVHCET